MEPFPKPVRPVAYRGRMTRDGYQPENHQWRCYLLDDAGHGRDPMALSLDVLSASGHPRASVRSVSTRLRVMHGTDHGREGTESGDGMGPIRLTTIREEVCMPCSAGNRAEVRRCPIYDCPCWPYRMGRNPHNPRRGKNPFAAKL
jgi:hypothetical protein